jgi:WW domain-binding protein 4
LVDVGVKRAADAVLPDEEDSRSFKLRKKALTGFGEIYDPGLILIKPKKEEQDTYTTSPTSTPQILASPLAHPIQLPKWKSLQLKRTVAGEHQNKEADDENPDVKPEIAVEHVPLFSTSAPAPRASKWVKSQWSLASEPTKMEDTSPPFSGVGEVKSEDVAPSDAKTEEDVSSSNLDVSSSAGSLFRKRKAPAGAGRGRRQI